MNQKVFRQILFKGVLFSVSLAIITAAVTLPNVQEFIRNGPSIVLAGISESGMTNPKNIAAPPPCTDCPNQAPPPCTNCAIQTPPPTTIPNPTAWPMPIPHCDNCQTAPPPNNTTPNISTSTSSQFQHQNQYNNQSQNVGVNVGGMPPQAITPTQNQPIEGGPPPSGPTPSESTTQVGPPPTENTTQVIPATTQPQVIEVASTPVTQLPATGAPIAGLALLGLTPLGIKLKNLTQKKNPSSPDKPNSIWEERELKK